MKIILTFVFIITNTLLFSQSYKWAKSINGNGIQDCRSVAVDDFGNVYTIGMFQGLVDFDPGYGEFIVDVGINNGTYLQKLDRFGDFIWVKIMEGSVFGNSIAIDESNNIYITGGFRDDVDFDPDSVDETILSSQGHSDIFIQKLNVDGDLIWVKRIGANGSDDGSSIHVDNNGFVYLTGVFGGINVDFDPSTNGQVVLNSIDHEDHEVFILKFNDTGEFIWARSFGGWDDDAGNCINVDANGNVYTVGSYQDNGFLSPDMTNELVSTTGSNDLFILKLNSAGELSWIRSIGNGGSEVAMSIDFDESNNIYLTGGYNNFINFDPLFDTAPMTNGEWFFNTYILKMTSAGSFVWVKEVGGPGSDLGVDLSLDQNSDIYITGYYSDGADLQPAPNIYNTVTSNGGEDIFIEKLNSNGDLLWFQTFGGVENDRPTDLMVDNYGSVYITGTYNDTVDFDPYAGVSNLVESNLVQSGFDGFVLKLSSEDLGTPDVPKQNNMFYPNPSKGKIIVHLPNNEMFAQLKIIDYSGRQVYEEGIHNEVTQLDLSNISSGVYLVRLVLGSGEELTSKIILTD